MKQHDTTELRLKTIAFWAGFRHPSNERDIARVYAFRELDPQTATDADVTAAYGDAGWAPVPVCVECGLRDDKTVTFGLENTVALCPSCIADAAKLAPKKSLFSRLIGA